MNKLRNSFSSFGTTILLCGAIIIGAITGSFSPQSGDILGHYSDYIILALVSLLFFEVRFEVLLKSLRNLRFLSIAWCVNFILIPTIGFFIASLLLSDQPLLFTGLVIYFMAPCTDWFLGFTRLAHGNTSIGAILIPINMVSQILLYPAYLALFAHEQVGVNAISIGNTLLHWFFLPFTGAACMHLLLKAALPSRIFERLLLLISHAVPFVISALVFCIFAANIGTMIEHASALPILLGAVFMFFVATYFLGEGFARHFKLDYPEYALFVMTSAARNAPLMLGITTTVLPNQPLIHVAIIIGMLIEFPHLTALKYILLKKHSAHHYNII